MSFLSWFPWPSQSSTLFRPRDAHIEKHTQVHEMLDLAQFELHDSSNRQLRCLRDVAELLTDCETAHDLLSAIDLVVSSTCKRKCTLDDVENMIIMSMVMHPNLYDDEYFEGINLLFEHHKKEYIHYKTMSGWACRERSAEIDEQVAQLTSHHQQMHAVCNFVIHCKGLLRNMCLCVNIEKKS